VTAEVGAELLLPLLCTSSITVSLQGDEREFCLCVGEGRVAGGGSSKSTKPRDTS
jgi:hypothetical protein